MARLIRIVSVIVLTLLVGAPVHAQDGGLTGEQQALVDRVLAALEKTESYTSYVSDGEGTRDRTIIITAGDISRQNSENTLLTRRTQYTTDANGQSNYNLTRIAHVNSSASNGAVLMYTITSEMRVVEGVLYLNAIREIDSGAADDLPDVPEGWVIVESEDDWPALEHLDLGDILNDMDGPMIINSNAILMFDQVSDITLEAGTLKDGTPVDKITVTWTGDELTAGVAAQLEARGEDPLPLVFDSNSVMTTTFSLNADDELLQIETDTTLTWNDIDLRILNPNAPEGSLFSQESSENGVVIISGINEPVTPITAPEM